MLRKILVPVDFSPASAQALAAARRVCPGGCKRLIHVLSPKRVADANHGSPINAAQARRELEEGVVKKLKEWAEPDDEIAVVVGSPADAIMAHAEAWGAEIIVMGTRGRSSLSNFLSGSATEYLVRHAKLPILVVHDTPQDEHAAQAVRDSA
ncbi:MAG: universal stress protein [Thioalkalivibrionaceae bacterium]